MQWGSNPEQGLTNLDSVISYPFGSFGQAPDNQKQNTNSIILA